MSGKFDYGEFGEFLTAHYGERCPDKEEQCIVCQVWEIYDEYQKWLDESVIEPSVRGYTRSRSFKELEAKMSPESIARSDAKAKQLRGEGL